MNKIFIGAEPRQKRSTMYGVRCAGNAKNEKNTACPWPNKSLSLAAGPALPTSMNAP